MNSGQVLPAIKYHFLSLKDPMGHNSWKFTVCRKSNFIISLTQCRCGPWRVATVNWRYLKVIQQECPVSLSMTSGWSVGTTLERSRWRNFVFTDNMAHITPLLLDLQSKVLSVLHLLLVPWSFIHTLECRCFLSHEQAWGEEAKHERTSRCTH